MTAESLMVMCDVTEKQMNRLLMEFRRREIRIDYKAVLTPTNRDWPVRRMYLEMARERAIVRQLLRQSKAFGRQINPVGQADMCRETGNERRTVRISEPSFSYRNSLL